MEELCAEPTLKITLKEKGCFPEDQTSSWGQYGSGDWPGLGLKTHPSLKFWATPRCPNPGAPSPRPALLHSPPCLSCPFTLQVDAVFMSLSSGSQPSREQSEPQSSQAQDMAVSLQLECLPPCADLLQPTLSWLLSLSVLWAALS